MSKLSIALAVKRKAKKMSQGGIVDINQDDEHGNQMSQGEEMEERSEAKDDMLSQDASNEAEVDEVMRRKNRLNGIMASMRKRHMGR